ncbi:MAG TPA: toll/interleukin-1 receptor domain-containing protein [Pyrinomonadaceae bacterium]|jgi:hypothetical protein
MSPIHTFTDDVFISYRHLDNKSQDDQGSKGWINNFHERFEIKLVEQLGYEPKIWRDVRLSGSSYFAGVLHERIKNTAVLISILSPGYIQSAWCMGELREFCRLAEETGGLVVGERLRIFKVVKTHIERDQHPPEFQKQLGYEFYEMDMMTQRPVEFRQELGRDRDQRYWDKLGDLAWDVKQVLYAINPRAVTPSFASVFPQSKGTIYLAQTTSDLGEERDQIKRELQTRGYDILPNKELPLLSPRYEEAVSEYVSRSKLSVHLIGGSYGIVPEGAEGRSIVRLQNDIAAERSRRESFSRLLWMPVGLVAREEEQAQFIDHLRTDAMAQQGAEFLQTPLEDLKTLLKLRLDRSNGHKPEAAAKESPPKIYFIFANRDFDAIGPLYDHLLDGNHYDVLLPLLEEESDDAAKGFDIHKANLMDCDAVLIYYGTANQAWFEGKRRDVWKTVGLNRQRPLRAEAVYIAPPRTAHKQLFNSPGAIVIKNYENFSPAELDSFLALVRGEKKGEDDAGD